MECRNKAWMTKRETTSILEDDTTENNKLTGIYMYLTFVTCINSTEKKVIQQRKGRFVFQWFLGCIYV